MGRPRSPPLCRRKSGCTAASGRRSAEPAVPRRVGQASNRAPRQPRHTLDAKLPTKTGSEFPQMAASSIVQPDATRRCVAAPRRASHARPRPAARCGAPSRLSGPPESPPRGAGWSAVSAVFEVCTPRSLHKQETAHTTKLCETADEKLTPATRTERWSWFTAHSQSRWGRAGHMPTASAGASGGGPSKHAVGAAARTASQGPRGFGTRRVAAESGRPPREPAARRRRDGA